MQGIEPNPETAIEPEDLDQEIENSHRYEYFIHYLGIDRRNDRWVTEQFIKIDPEEVQRQLELVKQIEAEKQNSYLPNDENHGMSEKEIAEFIQQTKLKTVESIQFGRNWLETWYFTPLPAEYHTKCLYVCDFCLFFCVHKRELLRHSTKCSIRHPPGDEIYRDKDISFFEVDGSI